MASQNKMEKWNTGPRVLFDNELSGYLYQCLKSFEYQRWSHKLPNFDVLLYCWTLNVMFSFLALHKKTHTHTHTIQHKIVSCRCASIFHCQKTLINFGYEWRQFRPYLSASFQKSNGALKSIILCHFYVITCKMSARKVLCLHSMNDKQQKAHTN